MAKKYIIGELATGNTSEANELPVIQGDILSFDIQGIDNSDLIVSKKDLPDPGAWKTYLKAGRKIVLAVDDTKAWDAHGEAIIGGGFILRTYARVNDAIRVKIAGPDEYLARRVLSSVYTGSVTNPETKAISLERNSYQGLIVELIKDCFTAKGAGTRPTPPALPITYPATSTGSLKYEALNTDFLTYAQALEELQKASPFGNEWRWQWQWTDASKNAVELVLTVGADTSAETSQIGSSVSENIILDNSSYKLVGFEESDDLDGSATRLIAQTKQGEGTSGADYVATVNAENDVLFDSTFNPGVELSSGQLTAQITARMSVLKNLQGSAIIEVAEPLTSWVGKLGNVLNISGGTDWRTSDYTIAVRLTKVSGSIVENTCKLEITPIQPSYPKLPPVNPFNPGVNIKPVTPRLPQNFTPPSGGITIPDFEIPNPNYGETESIFESVVTNTITSTGNIRDTFIQAGDYIYALNNYSIFYDKTTNTDVNTSFAIPNFRVQRIQVTDTTLGASWSTVGTLPSGTIIAEAFTDSDLPRSPGQFQNMTLNTNFFTDKKNNFYIHCFFKITLNTQGTGLRIKTKSVVFKGVLSGGTISSWSKESWSFSVSDDDNIFPLNTSIVSYGALSDSVAFFGGFVLPKDGTLPPVDSPAYPEGVLAFYTHTSRFKKFDDLIWSVHPTPPIIDMGTFFPVGGVVRQVLFPNILNAGGGVDGIMVENFIGVAENKRQQLFLTATQTELSGYAQNYLVPGDWNPGLVGTSAGDTNMRIPRLDRPTKVGPWLLSWGYNSDQHTATLFRTKPGFNSAIEGVIPDGFNVDRIRPGYLGVGLSLINSFSLNNNTNVQSAGGSQGNPTFGYKNTIIVIWSSGTTSGTDQVQRATLKPEFQ